MKKRKYTILFMFLLLVLAICVYVNIRGEYLQIVGIGEEYIKVFKTNLIQKSIVFVVSFLIIYFLTYITTVFVKKGLKKFFEDDKKTMPKLPNKSIALIFAVLGGIFCINTITEKTILLINNTLFATGDPIFNIDIGYYVFIKPFFETLVLYFIGAFAILSAYIVVYYIIAFNKFFDKGISLEIFKKSLFWKQILTYVSIIIVLFSIYSALKIQNIVSDKFLSLSKDVSIYGAGIIDVTIKTWGYIAFSILIIICLILGIFYLKQNKLKKLAITVGIVPGYLVALFLIMLIADLIYVKPDELDKEKKYIDYSIKYTKNAYGINVDEIEIESSGTITTEDINNATQVVNNINILNEDVVLNNLEEYQTSLGYYTFKNTKVGLYDINGKERLVYVSPREIISSGKRTFLSKTYEYTHGFGAIISFASKTDESGHLEYIKNGFLDTDKILRIKEPRIYFGTQTNTSIIINNNEETEYDYPLTSTTNTYNTYKGKTGIKLNFLDRIILGIKEGNLKLAFSTKTTDDSFIVTNRNIIKRAKMLMPYLIYDKNPYMVITEDGNLIWVLDAYTISNEYPYSHKSTINAINGTKQEINYIRNSVKVLINAYDGNMKFYITDKTDPIIMAYWKIYPEIFEKLDTKLPDEVAKHIVYPQFLYDIQSRMLETYHNIKAEVLYRGDDIWSIATENTSKLTSLTGTKINSYYTLIKTVDSSDAELGLLVPYTIKGKQNITAYLVGTYDPNLQIQKLKTYKFASDSAILGTIQLDTLIEQDETISNEINALNITGAKISKNIIIVPINNTLLYVEPIFQTMLNEHNLLQTPALKKVVVASGNKIAIGENTESAINNLMSQEAVRIEVEQNDLDALIKQIIKTNKNLDESNASNNWEMIGKDMSELQTLIRELEKTYMPDDNKKIDTNSIATEKIENKN